MRLPEQVNNGQISYPEVLSRRVQPLKEHLSNLLKAPKLNLRQIRASKLALAMAGATVIATTFLGPHKPALPINVVSAATIEFNGHKISPPPPIRSLTELNRRIQSNLPAFDYSLPSFAQQCKNLLPGRDPRAIRAIPVIIGFNDQLEGLARMKNGSIENTLNEYITEAFKYRTFSIGRSGTIDTNSHFQMTGSKKLSEYNNSFELVQEIVDNTLIINAYNSQTTESEVTLLHIMPALNSDRGFREFWNVVGGQINRTTTDKSPNGYVFWVMLSSTVATDPSLSPQLGARLTGHEHGHYDWLASDFPNGHNLLDSTSTSNATTSYVDNPKGDFLADVKGRCQVATTSHHRYFLAPVDQSNTMRQTK